MRQIQTISGNFGYRDQLDRVRRLLDRVEGSHTSDVELQDIMWSFFQHCWHLKDWIKNDPLASDAQKKAVVDQAQASALLKMCRDLCNGTKHLALDRKPSSGAGATHDHIATKIVPGESSDMDCIVQDGYGHPISGKQLARDCVKEWERILHSERLNTTRRS
jgi:hypothetical protein